MSCDTSDIFQVGDSPRLKGTFTDAAGAVVDPATVTFKIKNPYGTITTYVYGTDAQLVKLSTGIYYVDFDVTIAGTWFYRFSSTGTGKAADEAEFTVEESEF